MCVLGGGGGGWPSGTGPQGRLFRPGRHPRVRSVPGSRSRCLSSIGGTKESLKGTRSNGKRKIVQPTGGGVVSPSQGLRNDQDLLFPFSTNLLLVRSPSFWVRVRVFLRCHVQDGRQDRRRTRIRVMQGHPGLSPKARIVQKKSGVVRRFFMDAEGGTRTHTDMMSTWPSTKRVCQFRHFGSDRREDPLSFIRFYCKLLDAFLETKKGPEGIRPWPACSGY